MSKDQQFQRRLLNVRFRYSMPNTALGRARSLGAKKGLKQLWPIITILLLIGCADISVPMPTTTIGMPGTPLLPENISAPTGTPMSVPTLISTPVPTLTATPTMTSSPARAPGLPDCPTGKIMFKSYGEDPGTAGGIYVACADGTARQKIDPGPLRSLWWQLSPKGNVAVWISEEGDALIITDLSGQEIARLLGPGFGSGRIMVATWSTDGEYIAFVRKVTDKEGGIPYYRVDTVHIATETVSEGIIPADEYDEEVTLEGWVWIGWSPTANQLLLFHYEKPLHIADVLCDEITHICVADIRAVGVKLGRKYPLNAWSPDGNRIAYHCYTTTSTGDLIHEGICIQDTEGNMIQEFPEPELGVEGIDFLAWAPDGTQIAFVAYPGDVNGGRTDVFVLSLDDMSLINLTADPSLNQGDPVWIP